MRTQSRYATAFAAGIFALQATSAAVAIPLETYGRLPAVENVALSPDGTKLAFVRTAQDVRALAIVGVGDHKFLGGARLGDTKLRSLSWADNDHLLIQASETEVPLGFFGDIGEWWHLNVYEVSTHKLHNFPDPDLQRNLRMMNTIAGEPFVRSVRNDTILFVPGNCIAQFSYLCLFRVNLRTGQQTLVRQETGATRGWLVDESGEIIAESNYYAKEQRWEMRIRREGQWIGGESGHEAIDLPSMAGFGPTADSVLVHRIEGGERVWKALSLKDGRLGPLVDIEQNLWAPIEDRRTHRMIGGAYGLGGAKIVFFDPQLQSRWDSIAGAFPDERLALTSASSDLKKFVVLVDGPVHGYRYLLIDMERVRSEPIGNVYDGIDRPLQVRPIVYPAADGTKIPAYVTLPPDRHPERLPLVVLAHGGPAAFDTGRFSWWAQAMASQGYAVLQANFRGSDLSWQFMSAGFGEWGRKMQTDLSDGVRHLAKEGLIDPARVCIVGGSYGGYAALAGVTLDPGVYRCAVSVAGIADLHKLLQRFAARWADSQERVLRYWDRFMGASGPDDPILDALSPIRHLDRISVPVLLIHGRDDTVVPFEQSAGMLAAMQAAGKKVALVTLSREDHWLSRSATRLEMLQSSMAFLEANNPPN